ncbi:unnamed protein product, partial [Symbiodinium pilosum]
VEFWRGDLVLASGDGGFAIVEAKWVPRPGRKKRKKPKSSRRRRFASAQQQALHYMLLFSNLAPEFQQFGIRLRATAFTFDNEHGLQSVLDCSQLAPCERCSRASQGFFRGFPEWVPGDRQFYCTACGGRMAAKGLDTTDLATYSRALAPQRCFPAQRAAITMADNILSSSPSTVPCLPKSPDVH